MVTATINATAGFGGTVSFACSGTAQVTCSFSPSMLQPTATNPQTTHITVTAGYSASRLPLRDSARSRFLLLALILPFGMVFGIARTQMRAVHAAVGLLLISLIVVTLSCGGGSSGGGGGGGSNIYTITVSATVAGTNTTRTIGTINATVTH